MPVIIYLYFLRAETTVLSDLPEYIKIEFELYIINHRQKSPVCDVC